VIPPKLDEAPRSGIRFHDQRAGASPHPDATAALPLNGNIESHVAMQIGKGIQIALHDAVDINEDHHPVRAATHRRQDVHGLGQRVALPSAQRLGRDRDPPRSFPMG
jgi:hypothetical protein